jgi:hypothetical protein
MINEQLDCTVDQFDSLDQFLTRVKSVSSVTINRQEAYKRGKECGLNGATIENCHYSIFTTEENKKAWEKGRRLAQATVLAREEREEKRKTLLKEIARRENDNEEAEQ